MADTAAPATPSAVDRNVWIQTKLMPLLETQAMALKNQDSLKEFVKLVRAIDKTFGAEDLEVCRSVLVLVLTRTAPDVTRGFAKSTAMKEMLNWTLEHIKAKSTLPSLSMIKMFQALEFTASDLKELKMNILLKQITKEFALNQEIIDACAQLRKKWEADIEKELQEAARLQKLEEERKAAAAREEEERKAAQLFREQQIARQRTQLLAKTQPSATNGINGHSSNSNIISSNQNSVGASKAVAVSTPSPVALAPSSVVPPAPPLRKQSSEESLGEGTDGTLKRRLDTPATELPRKRSTDESELGGPSAIKQKDLADTAARPVKRSFITGLQGYKSKDDIEKEETKIDIIDDTPVEAKAKAAVPIVRSGPLSAEDVKRQRLARQLAEKRSGNDTGSGGGGDNSPVIVSELPTSLPASSFSVSSPPATEPSDTKPMAPLRSILRLRDARLAVPITTTGKRRVSFAEDANLVQIREFVADPEEHLHTMSVDALWNSEMQEGRGLRSLEPVIPWQRPASLYFPEEVVELACKRGSEASLFQDLHRRETVELGDSYATSAMAPMSAAEPADAEDRGERIALAPPAVLIPLDVPVVTTGAAPPPLTEHLPLPRQPGSQPMSGPSLVDNQATARYYTPAPVPPQLQPHPHAIRPYDDNMWVAPPYGAPPPGPPPRPLHMYNHEYPPEIMHGPPGSGGWTGPAYPLHPPQPRQTGPHRRSGSGPPPWVQAKRFRR